MFFFFFQAEDGIRDLTVTGVQTCALPISAGAARFARAARAPDGCKTPFAARRLAGGCVPARSPLLRRPTGAAIPRRLSRDARSPSAVFRACLFLSFSCSHRSHGMLTADLPDRSEEHTSELQSQSNLVCRLLLE